MIFTAASFEEGVAILIPQFAIESHTFDLTCLLIDLNVDRSPSPQPYAAVRVKMATSTDAGFSFAESYDSHILAGLGGSLGNVSTTVLARARGYVVPK